ncbi:MAG: ribonuclease HII [Hyphomicrobiales bacterium]|nr:ribonuclease HII [Hyphomicrobiales bacterium]
MGRSDSLGRPSLAPEAALAEEVGGLVCGIDEAGRGPWAGPVVAAAVILDPGALPDGLNDSKLLSAADRERLFGLIAARARIGVGVASREEVDAVNVLQATFRAMARAFAALSLAPAAALIDGNRAPDLPCPARTLVRGDCLSASLAAASIVAKVTRDRMMVALAQECPGYGWERNKGYGTPEHAAALDRLGVTCHHRLSFEPVREALEAAAKRRGRPRRAPQVPA